MSSTVRISSEARRTLRHLSEDLGEPMLEILNRAIEVYRRQCFLEEANKAYGALRKNKKAWQQEQRERAKWDVTLADGLKED